jgi:glycosyltransferase involved in cell wall biosynthesis
VRELHATIIGDGKSRHFLETLAVDLDVSDQLSFAGTWGRHHILEHLRDFDLLIQPSRYEGFGITVIEGMAAGVPVLVSDIHGPMEIIREGEYGSYFTSDQETDCAQKILEIMEQTDKAEFRERVEKARIYVNQSFSIKNTSLNYCDSYFNQLKIV